MSGKQWQGIIWKQWQGVIWKQWQGIIWNAEVFDAYVY